MMHRCCPDGSAFCGEVSADVSRSKFNDLPKVGETARAREREGGREAGRQRRTGGREGGREGDRREGGRAREREAGSQVGREA